MSHASNRSLRRFIVNGQCTPTFEAHVDRCEACAQRLSRYASQAAASPNSRLGSASPIHPKLAWCFSLLAAVFILLPRSPLTPAAAPKTENMTSSGMVDGGAAPKGYSAGLVAAFDAGGEAVPFP